MIGGAATLVRSPAQACGRPDFEPRQLAISPLPHRLRLGQLRRFVGLWFPLFWRSSLRRKGELQSGPSQGLALGGASPYDEIMTRSGPVRPAPRFQGRKGLRLDPWEQLRLVSILKTGAVLGSVLAVAGALTWFGFFLNYQQRPPLSQRAFVPEWTCYSKYEGGYCLRTGPPPPPAPWEK